MNWWNLAYLLRPPWDTGVVPPEVRALVEADKIPPGRAIDLGCGTGTVVVYLAQHGFQAVGVDIASRALAKAQRKAQAAGVSAEFHLGDVTRLGQPDGPPVNEPFDLAIDMGCFHGPGQRGRGFYAEGLARLTRPGSTYLLYAFLPGQSTGGGARGPRGVTPEEVIENFGDSFRTIQLDQRLDGFRPSAWYRLERI